VEASIYDATFTHNSADNGGAIKTEGVFFFFLENKKKNRGKFFAPKTTKNSIF